MLSQSRDERRRLEREGAIQQPQTRQHMFANVGGSSSSQQQHHHQQEQVDLHVEQMPASPSVFESIYEELDAGFGRQQSQEMGGGGRSAAAAATSAGISTYGPGRPATTSAGHVGGNHNHSADPRKSYLQQRGNEHMQQPPRTVHPSDAQAALAEAQAARARQMQQQQMQNMQQMQNNGGGAPQVRPYMHPQQKMHSQQQPQQQQNVSYHTVGSARSSLTQLHTRNSQPQTSVQSESYEPLSLSHTVMYRQNRSNAAAGSTAAGRVSARGIQGMGSVHRANNKPPDIDSLVIYGNDRADDMSENSGLSQQRLLKKRHGHKLGGSSSNNHHTRKSYPKRNPNKKSGVTIVGMPDAFSSSVGGGGNRNHPHGSSADAVPKTTENAYERRLARERMRSLVRIGSARMTNRSGGGMGVGGGAYDGVESVDGESTSFAAASSPTRQAPQPQQKQQQRSPQRGQQQQQQQHTPWWEGVDTSTTERSSGGGSPQRRIPRSDASADGHDGRGGYDFGSLPSATAASVDDSYDDSFEDMNGGNNATGAFPVRQTARGYDNSYPPAATATATSAAASSSSASNGPGIVPKRRTERPYLAHSSSAGKMMEPIVEEDGPIRVGEMEQQHGGDDGWEQDAAYYSQRQQQQPQQPSSPLNRSGENLFNQYSINPLPDVPHRRNIGEGGGPSPRLGVPPAPTSYYDRPDPNDPALASADQPYSSSYNDDPNIVVGQWESPQDSAWNDNSRKEFPPDKYEAAAAAAAAAIAGENAISPTSVAGDQQSSAFGATNRQLNYDEANPEPSSGPRAGTPNSVLTDEMSNPVPRGMITQRFSPDEISQRPPRSTPPRSSPQASLSSGQITPVDSTAAVAPAPDPKSQSQEERDRQKRIEKAHAIRQRRAKEAREHGEDLLRTSPERSGNSSVDGGAAGQLSPIDEIGGSPGGQLAFPNDAEWEPDEKPPSKRDIRKGRASEDLKGRVIDLSAPSSKREKPSTPRVTFQDAQFGFIEAVAAVVIQTFIRRYLAYKAATIRYEAALTVKDFIIASAQTRREAREQEEELEFAQRQAEAEARKRETILAKAHEQARMLSEADAAAIAEAENECLQQGDQEQQPEPEPATRNELKIPPQVLPRANLSEEDLAAIKIQAAFRGWWVRDCLSVDNYCATLIQQSVRGYLRRMEYEFDYYRYVIVQSAVRRFLAKRKASLARESAEYVEVRLAEEAQQVPEPAPVPAPEPRLANKKSWSVPSHSSKRNTANVPPRPEAKTQSFSKPTPVIIETGGGKGSLINAWKAREAQAQQQAAKPTILYQKSNKVQSSTFVKKTRTVMNTADEAPTTKMVETTRVQKSFMSQQKTLERVAAPVAQQQVKGGYSPEQIAAATKIQAQWRCYAAEMDFVHKLDSILLVQSLARRWVTMKLVLPYMIMARDGDYGGNYDEDEYYDESEHYYGEEGQYLDEYEEERVEVTEEAVPATPSPRNSSVMEMWKEKDAGNTGTTVEPVAARKSTMKINTGAGGVGSNSILQQWKQKEQEAIKARGSGR